MWNTSLVCIPNMHVIHHVQFPLTPLCSAQHPSPHLEEGMGEGIWKYLPKQRLHYVAQGQRYRLDHKHAPGTPPQAAFAHALTQPVLQ